jgi:hypothetical protein
MLSKHKEYQLGRYHVIEDIVEEALVNGVRAYHWRVTAYDEANQVAYDTAWTAGSFDDAQKQVAFAIARMKYALRIS